MPNSVNNDATPAGPFATTEASMGSGTLDLLLDHPLEVTICFGHRRLSLKDVLALNSGTVVELDQRVGAPIELLLAGRPVARGEAVIVDGHYGMRITEVISTGERLAQLT